MCNDLALFYRLYAYGDAIEKCCVLGKLQLLLRIKGLEIIEETAGRKSRAASSMKPEETNGEYGNDDI